MRCLRVVACPPTLRLRRTFQLGATRHISLSGDCLTNWISHFIFRLLDKVSAKTNAWRAIEGKTFGGAGEIRESSALRRLGLVGNDGSLFVRIATKLKD
jgi:hypothetical protein